MRTFRLNKEIYVDTVALPKGDKWLDYYPNYPERFPEVLATKKRSKK